jgi:hypothetical protein
MKALDTIAVLVGLAVVIVALASALLVGVTVMLAVVASDTTLPVPGGAVFLVGRPAFGDYQAKPLDDAQEASGAPRAG